MPAKTATYSLISNISLASTATSVTFSSIPGTFTDLKIITYVKHNSGEQSLGLRFNGSSAADYSALWMYGNGTTAASGRESSNNQIPVVRSDNSNFWIGTIDISDYANTTTFKPLISRGNSGTLVIAHAGQWRSTSAITSIDIIGLSSNSFVPGSTFRLYGIQAGNL